MCIRMERAQNKRQVRSDGAAMAHTSRDTLTGRQAESRRLADAVRGRASLLIWGPPDAGKTALVKTVIDRLPGKYSRNCIYWSGAASIRHLVGELVRFLYLVGDPVVRKKVRDDGAMEASLNRWLREQTSGRLRVVTEGQSPMDDSKTMVLALDSDDMVQGPNGAVRPSLMVHCEQKKAAVYVVTGIASSIEEDVEGGPSDFHKVGLRLDDAPANYSQWGESNDHKALFASDLR